MNTFHYRIFKRLSNSASGNQKNYSVKATNTSLPTLWLHILPPFTTQHLHIWNLATVTRILYQQNILVALSPVSVNTLLAAQYQENQIQILAYRSCILYLMNSHILSLSVFIILQMLRLLVESGKRGLAGKKIICSSEIKASHRNPERVDQKTTVRAETQMEFMNGSRTLAGLPIPSLLSVLQLFSVCSRPCSVSAGNISSVPMA